MRFGGWPNVGRRALFPIRTPQGGGEVNIPTDPNVLNTRHFSYLRPGFRWVGGNKGVIFPINLGRFGENYGSEES